MKILNSKWLYIGIILIFTSCDISKRATKSKQEREQTESSEVITKRKGDTVTYEIPNIKFKDTTIYVTNRQGTTLRTVYDNNGQISQIDCFASMIEEINRSNKLLIESIKDKDSEKKEEFNSETIIYFMLGLALIVLIIMIFVFKYMMKMSGK